MAYIELIKNFERVREYMREFYVYGFKSREEYETKSARTYDNERRRIESYLGEHMGFRYTPKGKNIFLSFDSRSVTYNPLYKALKAKSFTNSDIILHFILMDILKTSSCGIKEIIYQMDSEYLVHFQRPMVFDESTIRKKLKEYIELGLVLKVKNKKEMVYSLPDTNDFSSWKYALNFFSEVGLCGVIGSFLLDKMEDNEQQYAFKHHYITQAMDSEVVYEIFKGISQKRMIHIEKHVPQSNKLTTLDLIPLKIFISVQQGRQYLMAYDLKLRIIKSYRLDYITKIQMGEPHTQCNEYHRILKNMQKHMWGVLCNKKFRTEYVEFTVYLDSNEEHIYHRLVREKRCGQVKRMDVHTAKFQADVYNTEEMVPWIRTFICRITSIHFSNRVIENKFKEDIEAMYLQYEV